ncbi:hypothetical protein KF840_17510 [bacterium]|nr:hypothetical protein [bacterium]
MGIYLSGTNTRRLRGALAPLLRRAAGQDAISRLVGRLREDFHVEPAGPWRPSRSATCFSTAGIRGSRIGKRVRVPVLVTLGTCADGRRVLLDLRVAGGRAGRLAGGVGGAAEAPAGTPGVGGDRRQRPAWKAALQATWPQLDVQRCTNHKLWNLLAKAPARTCARPRRTTAG